MATDFYQREFENRTRKAESACNSLFVNLADCDAMEYAERLCIYNATFDDAKKSWANATGRDPNEYHDGGRYDLDNMTEYRWRLDKTLGRVRVLKTIARRIFDKDEWLTALKTFGLV